MLRHYITIAHRNLLKHKLRSLISITALTIGFVFFAISSYMIWYESSYDSFRENKDRIFLVCASPEVTTSPSMLAVNLAQTCPEVEAACTAESHFDDEGLYYFDDNDQEILVSLNVVSSTPQFKDVFDIKVLHGDYEFNTTTKNPVAISKTLAGSIFGNSDPIGRKFKLWDRIYTVTAVVESQSKHTILPYDVIAYNDVKLEYALSYSRNFVKLYNKESLNSFNEKIAGYTTIEEGGYTYTYYLKTYNISDVQRQTHLVRKNNLSYSYLVIFATSALILLICSFLNFFLLYLSNIKTRRNEIELRRCCGSSAPNIYILILFELSSYLIPSFIFSMIIIEISSQYIYSAIGLPPNPVYMIKTILLTILVILSLSILFLFIYGITRSSKPKNTNSDRSAKLILSAQFVICISFIFITSMMIRQISYLSGNDFGIKRHNTATLLFDYSLSISEVEECVKQIKELPSVKNHLYDYIPLFPLYLSISCDITDKTGKEISVRQCFADCDYFDFYSISLAAGVLFDESNDSQDIVVNPVFLTTFDIENPIGHMIDGYRIIGVTNDMHFGDPSKGMIPILFNNNNGFIKENSHHSMLLEFHEGAWDSGLKQKLRSLMHHKGDIKNVEKEYDKLIVKERILSTLLSLISGICILISLFGIYSMVSFSCEKRRKEIAIRKVNGAGVAEIVIMMLKQYMIIVVISSVLAFLSGSIIIKYWLRGYALQTTIPMWLYIVIFTSVLTFVIVSVVGKLIYVSRRNPAEEIRKE